jgi:hypothetical protein
MKSRTRLIVGLLAFFCLATANASVTQSLVQTPSLGGLRGLHLDSPLADNLPHGIILDLDGRFAWGMGIDATRDYPFVTPDMVFAYSWDRNADLFRMRADDARLALGQAVGHPVVPFQFNVEAGQFTAEGSGMGGMAISTWDQNYSLYLFNRRPNCRRTNLNLYNCFALLTDPNQNNTREFMLWNYTTNSSTFHISPTNAFKVTAPQIGFYGGTPVNKPVVTGSWAAGTAQKSVLAAMVQLGLVTDSTTP